MISCWHKSRCDEGSFRSCSKGKESIASGGEFAQLEYHHPQSMKELCGMTMRKGDVEYRALRMVDLSPRDPESEVLLHPQLAKELYVSSSEMLIDQAMKAMVWAKLPRKVMVEYKGTIGFKLGLQWTGQVPYKYSTAYYLLYFLVEHSCINPKSLTFGYLDEKPIDTDLMKFLSLCPSALSWYLEFAFVFSTSSTPFTTNESKGSMTPRKSHLCGTMVLLSP
ncbi:hypothetical protein BHE74_00034758 [Ensete ventricosum]|nr:hypothetical protein BHE74_00034758 [Ensete ventricosum]